MKCPKCKSGNTSLVCISATSSKSIETWVCNACWYTWTQAWGKLVEETQIAEGE